MVTMKDILSVAEEARWINERLVIEIVDLSGKIVRGVLMKKNFERENLEKGDILIIGVRDELEKIKLEALRSFKFLGKEALMEIIWKKEGRSLLDVQEEL